MYNRFDKSFKNISLPLSIGLSLYSSKFHLSHIKETLKSLINLSRTIFLDGSTGQTIDIRAREFMWERGLDYKCGTGHGVSYMLNVHEGPNGFRCDNPNLAKLEEGMITTNEPGFYAAGSHGIRLENEMLCVKGEKNEFGQFMEFEPITIAPIDLDAIDPTLMSKREIKMLNDYHAMVYEKLSPYMTEEENIWLKKYTRSI